MDSRENSILSQKPIRLLKKDVEHKPATPEHPRLNFMAPTESYRNSSLVKHSPLFSRIAGSKQSNAENERNGVSRGRSATCILSKKSPSDATKSVPANESRSRIAAKAAHQESVPTMTPLRDSAPSSSRHRSSSTTPTGSRRHPAVPQVTPSNLSNSAGPSRTPNQLLAHTVSHHASVTPASGPAQLSSHTPGHKESPVASSSRPSKSAPIVTTSLIPTLQRCKRKSQLSKNTVRNMKPQSHSLPKSAVTLSSAVRSTTVDDSHSSTSAAMMVRGRYSNKPYDFELCDDSPITNPSDPSNNGQLTSSAHHLSDTLDANCDPFLILSDNLPKQAISPRDVYLEVKLRPITRQNSADSVHFLNLRASAENISLSQSTTQTSILNQAMLLEGSEIDLGSTCTSPRGDSQEVSLGPITRQNSADSFHYLNMRTSAETFSLSRSTTQTSILNQAMIAEGSEIDLGSICTSPRGDGGNVHGDDSGTLSLLSGWGSQSQAHSQTLSQSQSQTHSQALSQTQSQEMSQTQSQAQNLTPSQAQSQTQSQTQSLSAYFDDIIATPGPLAPPLISYRSNATSGTATATSSTTYSTTKTNTSFDLSSYSQLLSHSQTLTQPHSQPQSYRKPPIAALSADFKTSTALPYTLTVTSLALPAEIMNSPPRAIPASNSYKYTKSDNRSTNKSESSSYPTYFDSDLAVDGVVDSALESVKEDCAVHRSFLSCSSNSIGSIDREVFVDRSEWSLQSLSCISSQPALYSLDDSQSQLAHSKSELILCAPASAFATLSRIGSRQQMEKSPSFHQTPATAIEAVATTEQQSSVQYNLMSHVDTIEEYDPTDGRSADAADPVARQLLLGGPDMLRKVEDSTSPFCSPLVVRSTFAPVIDVGAFSPSARTHSETAMIAPGGEISSLRSFRSSGGSDAVNLIKSSTDSGQWYP